MQEIALRDVSKRVQDAFNRGFAALERGKVDYAIEMLFACVEQEPRFFQARKFLRAAEIRKAKAETHKLKATMTRASSLPAYLRAMAIVNAGKRPEEGLLAVEKLLQYDPLNQKYLELYIQAALAAGMPEAAVMTLEAAHDQLPDSIPIITWLGEMYMKMERTSSARQCFERLCELCPNDPEALKALKDAMALDSMQSDGWERAAEKGGSFREMIRDAKEAELLEQEAKVVKSDRDVDALIADLRVKIEKEPGNINYRRTLARLYLERRQFADAVTTIEEALRLNPGDPDLDGTMTEIHVQRFDYEIAQLRDAGDADGAEAREHEKSQFVFDNLQERVERYPNDLGLKFELGVLLFENEYTTEAIQQFQAAQRSPKHRVRALYYLGLCFKTKRQYDLAVRQLETAASEIYQMDKAKKEIVYELGSICEMTGETARAADYFKQIYQVDIGYRDVAEKVEQVYSG
jgi:tetratricopeptide (TPR) repeat protein